MFVLRRTDGAFVAKPGHDKSYTNTLEYARKYPTKEEAERDRCVDNESVVDLEELLNRYRN